MNINIDNYNRGRVNIGLPKVHHVWCHVCKSRNNHLWYECPNLKCPYCGGQHPYFTCNYFNACQWCGSVNHISQQCNDQKGLILKAGLRKTCFKCGRLGHIAAVCYAINKRGWRFRGRRRRRGRRWRRRRR